MNLEKRRILFSFLFTVLVGTDFVEPVLVANVDELTDFYPRNRNPCILLIICEIFIIDEMPELKFILNLRSNSY